MLRIVADEIARFIREASVSEPTGSPVWMWCWISSRSTSRLRSSSGGVVSGLTRLPPTNYSGSGVDLRLLERSGVVDVDALPFGEHLERLHACLAVAVAGVLGAAEREVGLRADGGSVHV